MAVHAFFLIFENDHCCVAESACLNVFGLDLTPQLAGADGGPSR